jgi:hypothetical protein
MIAASSEPQKSCLIFFAPAPYLFFSFEKKNLGFFAPAPESDSNIHANFG